MKLRAYQQQAIDRAREAIASGKRAPLLVAPTGSGKTVCIGEICRLHLEGGEDRRVLIVAHRSELLTQAAKTLQKFGLTDIGIISPNHTPRPRARIQIASTQTLRAREGAPFATLLVIDESHHYSSDDWSQLLTSYPDVIRVGFTATPCRSDGRGLGTAFDCLIEVTSIKELTLLGVLAPCRILCPDQPLKAPQLTCSPVDAYLQYARCRHTVVFADSVANAELFLSEFRAKGVNACIVHGKLSQADRARVFEQHKRGHVLINVMVLTEGWDSPQTSVCILARGCGSVSTYLQIAGRVLRCHPGKTEALLIDLTGRAVHQHGPPDEDRVYSLDGKGISREEPNPVCPVCSLQLDREEPYPCPGCGYKPPERGLESPEYTGDPLVERFAQKRTEDEPQRIDSLARWIAEVRAKGWKPWSASAKYRAVYGTNPPQHILRAAMAAAKRVALMECAQCSALVARVYSGGICGKCYKGGKR